MSAFNLKNLKPKHVPDLTDKLKNSAFLAPSDRERLTSESVPAFQAPQKEVAPEIPNFVSAPLESSSVIETILAPPVLPKRDEPNKTPTATRGRPKLDNKKERRNLQIHMPKNLLDAIARIAVQEDKHRNRVLEDLLESALKGRKDLGW